MGGSCGDADEKGRGEGKKEEGTSIACVFISLHFLLIKKTFNFQVLILAHRCYFAACHASVQLNG